MVSGKKPRHRRGKDKYDPPWTRVKWGAAMGLWMSLCGLLVGALRMGLAQATGTSVPPFTRHTALLLPAYIVAFVVPGGVIGLLWPLSRWWIGRAALGFLFSFLFWIAPLVWEYGWPTHWTRDALSTYVGVGVILGFIAWYVFSHTDAP